MPRHVVSPDALRDLLGINLHLSDLDVDAADRMAARFDEVFRMLARMPHLGRLRPELRHEVRSFAVRSYVVLYRATADGVEIHRVSYGRRDISSILRD